MDKGIRALTAILTFLASTAPLAVFAQQGGLPRQIVPCSGVDCNLCHLADLAQNLINTGIFIVVLLSAILFAYAGWLYMTQESISGQQNAKTLFKNTVFGLVIILSAWLIVDTLMKELLDAGKFGSGGAFGPWNQLQCNLFTP